MNFELSGGRWRLAGLILVVALPIAGSWMRRQSGDRCALDGAPIEHLLKVRVVDRLDNSHSFCCIQCALWWQQRQTAQPKQVFVTDEASGREIQASAAHFVRSTVITTPTTGNRIHAFYRLSDAEQHVEAYRGSVLSEAERPFLRNSSSAVQAESPPAPSNTGRAPLDRASG